MYSSTPTCNCINTISAIFHQMCWLTVWCLEQETHHNLSTLKVHIAMALKQDCQTVVTVDSVSMTALMKRMSELFVMFHFKVRN